jgi:aldehyde:ferredoxin oxidoreductase
MTAGYMGRIGFVNLTTGDVRQEVLDSELARSYIGGQGLGAKVLFELMAKGADPLGPDNILGFTTGPLTGTKTPTGARYMAVCKSPLTGGWGDANSGGFFGSELKAAGWDAIFVSGAAPSAKYLLVTDGRIELRDASHLWGKDTNETEDILQKELANSRLRCASIGPAAEKLSLISAIVNDKGRAAGRSGVGAVMGSKRLKAIAVHGTGKVQVADKDKLDQLRKEFVEALRSAEGFPKALTSFGTCGLTRSLVASGATPIKNWLLAGEHAFPNLNKITDPDIIIADQSRKYGCANCPIACGGIFNVTKGPYPVTDAHKPEYETVGAFGTMCMNDDYGSIIKANDMCNRAGLDTISAGTVIAFAMECYEKGLITSSDTDGIELRWGNTEAIIAILDKIVTREGFGDVLADGVKVAAAKIGPGAAECAIQVGGQEPGLHNALFLPSRGTGYVCDPTPGRHTAAVMARIDAGPGQVGPYPELKLEGFDRYEYASKGPMSARLSSYLQVGASAGVCLFPMIFFGNYKLLDYLKAVTGWDLHMAEALETGARIQTLRQCFNLREGLRSEDIKLPPRMAGVPPKQDGPLKNVSIDIDSLAREYRQAMGWDTQNGQPAPATLEKLGLKALIDAHS